ARERDSTGVEVLTLELVELSDDRRRLSIRRLRQVAYFRKIYSDVGPYTGRRGKRFRGLRARRVILIRRNRDGRQNPDNGHNDHQFDEREALLHLPHSRSSSKRFLGSLGQGRKARLAKHSATDVPRVKH